jgi:hypothetical protein
MSSQYVGCVGTVAFGQGKQCGAPQVDRTLRYGEQTAQRCRTLVALRIAQCRDGHHLLGAGE